MRIRILTSHDGVPCGAEVDVNHTLGAALCARGDAEPVNQAPAPEPIVEPAAVAPVLETAVADAPVETRKGKGKK